LLQIRGADGEVAVENDADPGIVYDGPLVILASSMTARAAEILTGTVRDYQRGIIVGDNNTFGKGTVLNVVKLDDLFRSINLRLNAGSLQYENAIFFGVSGSSNQQLGIKADIVLPSLTDEMPIGESYSPNHLPWERIAARKYEVWDPAIADKISVLEKASKERRAADPEFQLMEQEIANYKRYQQKKQVSLNEEERWEEYMSEKTAAEQQEKLLPQIDGGDGKDDPLLDEAVFIAADYAVLLKSE
jgi:carboxyl-terminal processing protease